MRSALVSSTRWLRSPSRLRVPHLVLLALVVAAPSAAQQEPDDLSVFFGPGMFVGDLRVFREDNGDRFESRLQSLKPWKGTGQKAKFLRLTNGRKTGTSTLYSKNGKAYPETYKSRAIKVVPKKLAPISSGRRTRLGRKERFSYENRVLRRGKPFASEKLKGSSKPRRIESISTPKGEFASALRIETSEVSTIRYEQVDDRVVVKTTGTSWYAEGFGLVRRKSRTRTFVNGKLEEDTGTRIVWLEDGTLDGVSLFEPPEKEVPPRSRGAGIPSFWRAGLGAPNQTQTQGRARARLALDDASAN